ncbi:PREDICTED: uncharacterized protein LOC104609062 [Nelumbo nucifera]|uniref:Uncharacterized protein LOC104609062 n=1 Tax=Nelumbo nucifera TaxID=4432 RepID=A0A1U8BAT3_NELNU|nr:PREDICTED: uncharacterized protein LOC104609062 [Nelumbo nucifera]XP_010273568.1 PREDICTED: uncharacterized protein LOC104609062 [Nelumbo nucifera]
MFMALLSSPSRLLALSAKVSAKTHFTQKPHISAISKRNQKALENGTRVVGSAAGSEEKMEREDAPVGSNRTALSVMEALSRFQGPKWVRGAWDSKQFPKVEKTNCGAVIDAEFLLDLLITESIKNNKRPLVWSSAFSFGAMTWLSSAQLAYSSEQIRSDMVYEIGELFELGIQLTYLLLLLGLLGVGTFFVIRQVLVRRELDLSAKELQEQVRSGDASATGLFELGAVMLRRKFYPAATKYLLQAIEKWDGDDQDLAQVYNALGVSYIRDGKLDKGISQFENAVKLQPGYVTAWNNLGDAYEQKKELKSALKAFEEVLLFDPNNKVARPRRDALKERVKMYKGVPLKSKKER